MRIAVLGGGPGGLLFAARIRRLLPEADVDLFERNAAGDAFGFGVVFSHSTRANIDSSDSVLGEVLSDEGESWDAIEVRVRGDKFAFAGNGMGAVLRSRLLSRLQSHAVDAGVRLHFSASKELADLADYDVIVAADGANSTLRRGREERLGVEFDHAEAKFIWFATTRSFDGLTFVHVKDESLTDCPAVFAAHAYPIGGGLSTFIVETDERTWRAAGLDTFDASAPPGVSDEASQTYLESLFSHHLEGENLVANNSRWANFRTITARSWHDGNIVFLGDAVHTAHFSVGSGTKMAMEDALSLASWLAEHPNDLEAAFAAYEAERMPAVAHIQAAAVPSLDWWEHFGELHDAMEPWQFAFHFFSRSIGLERIRRRDPHAAESAESAWLLRHGSPVAQTSLALATAPETRLDTRILERADLAGLDLPVLDAVHDEYDSCSEIDRLVAAAPPAVVVSGGNTLTRHRAAAALRRRRIPAIVMEADCDDDTAVTMILSGRTDAVVR